MRWFDDMPISRKVTLVILLTTGAALVAAGIGVIATEIITTRREIRDNLRVTADLLGRNASAPLTFHREEDMDEVQATLAALDADPTVMQAVIYDREGEIFARYNRNPQLGDLPPRPPPDGHEFGDGFLQIVHPITSNSRRVGTILARADLTGLYQRLLLHAGIVVLILLLTIIATIGLAPRLRRPISQPILALAEVARRIASSRDYSARAVKRGDDEVGLLTDAFNQMIEEVGAAQASLQRANASMQTEIAERIAVEGRLRQAHEELKQAIAAAQAANRAKDEFLAVLSHELRTPLTPVLMAVSLLEDDKDLPPQAHDEIEAIRRHVELEARLIDDLLDLTRITRGKLKLTREVTDLHVLVHDALRICCADRMEDITVHLDATEHHIHADAGRILQVCWNLLNNAGKFTPAGRPIVVTSSNPAPGRIRLEVRDSGIGIEPEALSRIFSAFEQGDVTDTRRFGGLGLGLAISKALVEAHEGTISATSEGPGKGATFTVELATVPAPQAAAPMAPSEGEEAQLLSTTSAEPVDQADRSSSADQSEPSEADKGLRLLLVEDHAESLQLMSRLLRARGYVVRAASNMAEALAIADEHPIDLVVSDLGLPDGTGLELMRQLRRRHGLRGICLTGFGMDEDIARSAEAGFCQHLTKPIDFGKLQEAIESIAGEG